MIKDLIPSWLHIPNREDNIFSIVFFIILTVPLIFVSLFPESYETVKYPLFLFMTGLGALVLFLRRQLYFHPAVLILLVALWALHILSSVFSLDFANSLTGLYMRYVGSTFFITGWVLFIVLIWNAVRQQENRTLTLLRLYLFVSLLIAAFGISQYFDFAYYAGLNPTARPIIPSFIGNQNFFAMFVSAALPAAVILWESTKNFWAKLYYSVAALIIVWGIILSGSRGAMLGLGAMLGILAVVTLVRKYPKKYIVGILVVAAASIALYAGFFAGTRSDTVQGSSANAEYTVQTRYIVWNDTVQVISKYPLLGTGPGNFFIAFENIGSIALSGNERFDDAHNFFLNTAATVGLPALVVLLVLLFIVLRTSWKETADRRSVGIWSIAVLPGLLVAFCFSPVSIPLWLLLGMIIAIATADTAVLRDIKLNYKVLGIAAASALMVFSVLFTASEALSSYGYTAYRTKDYKAADKYLDTSIKLNPYNSNARVYLIGTKIALGAKPEEIVKETEKMLAEHKLSSGMYKHAGNIYYLLYRQTGNEEYIQKIGQLYDEAIRLEPNFSNLYASAAYTFYKADKPDEALKYLDQLLSFPDNAESSSSWLVRAKIYQDKGQKEQAIFALEKAYAQMTDQIFLRNFLRDMRNTNDVKSLTFPFLFAEIEI